MKLLFDQENYSVETDMSSLCNSNQPVQTSRSESELKCYSPSRSQSFREPNTLSNMNQAELDEECYRLRHFSVTGKGVINRGDSFKIGRSRSNSSVVSVLSNQSKDITVRSNTASPPPSSRGSTCSAVTDAFIVAMLGSTGVGKSSLVNQVMTSEYLHAYDTYVDDELGEKSVSVLLNGEESELTFIDRPNYSVVANTKPHAYCIVYSTSDKSSFYRAHQLLQTLSSSKDFTTKVVILVANKTDLVRSRVVSAEDGKNLATAFNCKIIETSVAINHNVDELLVGILTQIRLRLALKAELVKTHSTNPAIRKYKRSKTLASIKVKGLLSKVWGARRSSSCTCENLQQL